MTLEGGPLPARGAGRALRLGQRPAEHRAPDRGRSICRATQREINLALPMQPLPELAQAAYDEGASRIGAELEQGRDVAVLCEGDPLFYGSFSQLLARLAGQYADRDRAGRGLVHRGGRRGPPAAGRARRELRRGAGDPAARTSSARGLASPRPRRS